MPELRILGVMTGTSCDGLDAACISIPLESGQSPDSSGAHGAWRALWSFSTPYPAALRSRVLEAQKPGTRRTFAEYLALHRDLGEWYGTVLSRALAKAPPRQFPDAIANHGQTVAHFPAPRRQGMTLQLGDPSRIALATGLTTITQFRDGDLAAGGQGAPLVTRFHLALARRLARPGEGVAIHNVGGISNFSYVPPQGDSIIAFDTGPGNIWIDAATSAATRGRRKFDRGGALGTKGRVDSKAVTALLRHPYFQRRPPKSTGRDDFPFRMLQAATRAQGADLVATATQVTVESIARAYERFVLDARYPLHRVFIAGGGAFNRALIEKLRTRLPGVRITTLTEAGYDSQLLEAQAFAWFGYLGLLGCPIGGAWTGAAGFAPPAHVVPGRNWGALQRKLAWVKEYGARS